MSLDEQLRRGNLAYRDPALYDDLLAEDPTSATVAVLTSGHAVVTGPGRVSVLDLGCATGRVLYELYAVHGWTGVGVDLQPALVATARTRTPALEWVCDDLRRVRLGRTFDVVLSVGNTPAYLHTDDELAELLDTARVHTRPGSLLVLATLTAAPLVSGRPRRLDVATRHGSAAVEMTTTWDPARRLVTTSRTWRFSDRTEHDHFTRRVWGCDELRDRARAAGFEPIGFDGPDGVSLVARRVGAGSPG